jgi:hypothetical protein
MKKLADFYLSSLYKYRNKSRTFALSSKSYFYFHINKFDEFPDEDGWSSVCHSKNNARSEEEDRCTTGIISNAEFSKRKCGND